MIPLHRFTVVLDACTLFAMLVRDVLLTLAGHEFFNPKWSARIRAEWMRNLSERLGERSFHGNTVTQVQRIATAMDAAFPDAAIEFECAEAAILESGKREVSSRWVSGGPRDVAAASICIAVIWDRGLLRE